MTEFHDGIEWSVFRRVDHPGKITVAAKDLRDGARCLVEADERFDHPIVVNRRVNQRLDRIDMIDEPPAGVFRGL